MHVELLRVKSRCSASVLLLLMRRCLLMELVAEPLVMGWSRRRCRKQLEGQLICAIVIVAREMLWLMLSCVLLWKVL